MRRLAVLVMVLAAGCGGNPLLPRDRVRAAIRATESAPRGFAYQDEDLEREVLVRGEIEDDYRYRARLSIDGVETLDEVALDDALSVRYLESSAAGMLGGEIGEVLKSHRWVLDATGAPELTASSQARRNVGQDPVLDSLTVFSYLQRAIQESESVVRFNRESIDYNEREDRFPKPAEGSPLARFDLKAPQIPPFTGTAGGTLPEVRHFRKMSVYVKDGRVLQVMEEIDLATRYERLVAALDLNVPAGLSGGQRLAFAIEALNTLRAARGTEPIRIRRMSVELIDVGRPVSIELPAEAIAGSLNVIPNRGRMANVAGQAGT